MLLLLTTPLYGQSASASPFVALVCNSGEARLMYASWGDSTVRAVCFSESEQKTGRSEVMMTNAPGVSHVFPLGEDFYAVSWNKVYRFYQYPWDGNQVRSWRTFGGVPFDPDPVSCADDPYYGRTCWGEAGLSFRFPWEKEGTKFSLNGDGTSFTRPLANDPWLACISRAVFKGYEYCLDSRTWAVIRPNPHPFSSTAWLGTTDFFTNRQSINMATNGERLFVSLTSEGRIVALSYTGGRFGNELAEETVVNNVGILADAYQNRLAVSQTGLYFVHRVVSGGGVTAGLNGVTSYKDEVWFFQFRTGRVMQILSGRDGETLSGLSVSPSQYYGGRG
ncbi:MAG: hypothetical protein A3C71_01080 [Candidatus Yanofskybacteria bacterium RIFCSPHIGHO2_02_FULL_43_15c]|uniref:Uncharacterized protein n=1 Tax=Candidatus Yanofskybacteria bacterium RIFCSPHIGHO2_02_FULL_43_15c TaxID=1802679 RepID=A0A1F8FIE3_9BACT|nr:MAG: hypothetical protein A3C71_01080 [Candidatus Yanofskybacteria bacterium RIFCSPHIGHO2_02_FULL_43_15c]